MSSSLSNSAILEERIRFVAPRLQSLTPAHVIRFIQDVCHFSNANDESSLSLPEDSSEFMSDSEQLDPSKTLAYAEKIIADALSKYQCCQMRTFSRNEMRQMRQMRAFYVRILISNLRHPINKNLFRRADTYPRNSLYSISLSICIKIPRHLASRYNCIPTSFQRFCCIRSYSSLSSLCPPVRHWN
ncbi:hypothetical protein GEMRC1_009142 [Eukaryota sp. GEM-RC1]